ncbi:MAG: KH domain-containing protein [Candidatus Daviesbacteria bacterium]|nr:KH domain-containing protein [Candidatus Daviesbacteria bacterium]
MQESTDATLLEQIIKAFVDEPEKVTVERKVDEMGVLLLVKLDEKDAGLVIGKAGSTIMALRKIMGVIGMKANARYNIKLDVPEKKGARPPRH